ncbi:hypothetical protein ASE12_08915 [Aeromicrobium sp. Root236]|uniref:hypothetical protein n=1 Tax=Aeromicrobium sp. Root236 TaxID=1736498 RepID=UPI0006FE3099|nr:hypothetical protein [Aeromicrobium sp. Root236]KRC64871.1 hypothetical protein ASE12_08915 [Aeromicrobium sp. Root236]
MSIRSAARNAGGWLLTAVGVVAIIVLVSGDHRFSGAAQVTVAIVAGIALLVPAAVGAAYMLVRRRNRSAEATAGQRPVSAKSRALQTSLASMLDRVNESTDDALGLRRVVLADRLELTSANLGELDDPWEALSYIWFVRPSQPADFPQSPRFAGLPLWAQDAVVLLDLRRELQLRGLAPALSDAQGFYHHAYGRIAQAAARTRSAELLDVVREGQRAAIDPARGAEHEVHARQLLALLDDRATWAELLRAT